MAKEKYIGEALLKDKPTTPLSFKFKEKSVKTKHIDDNAVTERTILDSNVTNSKIANDAVTSGKIGTGEVKTSNIGDGQVTSVKIGTGEVKTANIAGKAVTTAKIDDEAVNTAQIHDGAVSTNKIYDRAVTSGKIGVQEVHTENIKDLNVTTPKLADGNVTWGKLSNDAKSSISNMIDDAADDITNRLMRDVNTIMSDYRPIEISGNVNNAADEEDLTSVSIGGTDVIRLKDKAYAPTIYSGLGRVYLRKNMVNGVNVLTQEMFEDGQGEPLTNTVFVIQYDYDLSGETITIPDGCTLEFNGGRLKNGKIDFNSCIIQAQDKEIFKEDLLPVDDCVFLQDIRPYWFGAVGDGVYDDTDAWEKCLSFAEKVRANTVFRNYTQTFGCISADRKSRFKITSPLTVTFQTDIIGGFDFYYYGTFPAYHTGIINFFGTFSQCTFVFNVVHAGLNPNNTGAAFYPNWSGISDSSEYAGVVIGNEDNPTTMEECQLTIRVNKCWIGIWVYGHSGTRYFSCNTFSYCKFFTCMYGFVNTFISTAWNNDLKFFNCQYRPTGSSYTLPSDFSLASFIRVDGDGEYNMNTTVIDDLSLEGKPVKGNTTALWIKKTNTIRGLRISNVRIENTGSPIIVSNGKFDRCLIDNMKNLSDYHTVSIGDITFNSRYVDLPGIGVIQKPVVYDNEILLWNDEIVAEMRNGSFQYATRPYIVFTNTSSTSIYDERKTSSVNHKWAYLFAVNPGGIVQITTSNVSFQAKIFNENLAICEDIPNTVLPIGNLKTSTIGSVMVGYSPNGVLPVNVPSKFYFANISENPIYISIQDTTNNLSHVSLSVKCASGASPAERYYYNKQGTSVQRPVVMGDYGSTQGDSNFTYLDTTVNSEVIWNKKDWVLSCSYSSNKVSGTTSERPQLGFCDDGFAYYDYDLNKRILAKISNQIFLEETVNAGESKVIENTLTGGKSYWVGYSKKQSYGGTVTFRKTQDSEDEQIVILPNFNIPSLGRYFSAPAPSAYPYIYINNRYSQAETLSFYTSQTDWIEQDGATAGVLRSGNTVSRPIGSDIYIGFMYMDTEVGKPIYAKTISEDTVTWVDATGAEMPVPEQEGSE